MGIVSYLLVCLIAGGLATVVTGAGRKFSLPGSIVLGAIGAFVGGFIGGALYGLDVTGFNLLSILVAFVGAVIFLLIVRAISGGPRSGSPRSHPIGLQTAVSTTPEYCEFRLTENHGLMSTTMTLEISIMGPNGRKVVHNENCPRSVGGLGDYDRPRIQRRIDELGAHYARSGWQPLLSESYGPFILPKFRR